MPLNKIDHSTFIFLSKRKAKCNAKNLKKAISRQATLAKVNHIKFSYQTDSLIFLIKPQLNIALSVGNIPTFQSSNDIPFRKKKETHSNFQ